MSDIFMESGEILDFVGMKKTRVRGEFVTDGMGRSWISPNERGSEDLLSIMPDSANLPPEIDGKESDEYVFWIDVIAWKPTGEFRDE